MIHTRATPELQGAAALYALGSLSQHEAAAFEIHLRDGCRICETELEHAERVVSEIGLGAPEIDPPPYLRDLLLARVEREAYAQIPTAAPRVEPAPAAPAEAPQAAPAPIFATASSPPSAVRFLPWAVAALFAVAGGLMLFEWKAAEKTIAESKETAAAAQAEVRRVGATLELERAKSRELEQIKELLSPGAKFIRLTGQPAAPQAGAVVLWDASKSRWAVSSSLPPAPAGMAYQLWLLAPGSRISAGLLEVDASGRGFAIVEIPGDIKFTAAAITLEPDGGSAQPTMPLYALGVAE